MYFTLSPVMPEAYNVCHCLIRMLYTARPRFDLVAAFPSWVWYVFPRSRRVPRANLTFARTFVSFPSVSMIRCLPYDSEYPQHCEFMFVVGRHVHGVF